MEIPIRMDDLGVPPFFETPIYESLPPHENQMGYLNKKLLACEQTRRMCWTDGVYDSHEN